MQDLPRHLSNYPQLNKSLKSIALMQHGLNARTLHFLHQISTKRTCYQVYMQGLAQSLLLILSQLYDTHRNRIQFDLVVRG